MNNGHIGEKVTRYRRSTDGCLRQLAITGEAAMIGYYLATSLWAHFCMALGFGLTRAAA